MRKSAIRTTHSTAGGRSVGESRGHVGHSVCFNDSLQGQNGRTGGVCIFMRNIVIIHKAFRGIITVVCRVQPSIVHRAREKVEALVELI